MNNCQNVITRVKEGHLIHGNAESLPFRGDQLDILLSLHNVEHLYHPELFLAEAYRVLKPEGTLIFATPNPIGIGAKVMRKSWGGVAGRSRFGQITQPVELFASQERIQSNS